MPRIYTKTGDDGTTGLLYGGRVPKSDPITEAYGTTDEAVAALGLARSLCRGRRAGDDLLALQRELFVVGRGPRDEPRERGKLEPEVSAGHATGWSRGSSGGSTTSWRSARSRGVHRARREPGERGARLARGVVRRAERPVVALEGPQREVNPEVRRYLNRLSDLFFVLARWQAGEAEPASR